ncbi:MAG: hypothetical protein U0939_17865 [Pirellulales bacterium]
MAEAVDLARARSARRRQLESLLYSGTWHEVLELYRCTFLEAPTIGALLDGELVERILEFEFPDASNLADERVDGRALFP